MGDLGSRAAGFVATGGGTWGAAVGGFIHGLDVSNMDASAQQAIVARQQKQQTEIKNTQNLTEEQKQKLLAEFDQNADSAYANFLTLDKRAADVVAGYKAAVERRSMLQSTTITGSAPAQAAPGGSGSITSGKIS